MDDLISRQAVNDALDKTCDIVCQYSKKQRYAMCGACPLGSAFGAVANVPSVDAVEVVQCKDCKYQEKYFYADKRLKDGGRYTYGCDLADGYSHVCLDDDFCSRGERKDDV